MIKVFRGTLLLLRCRIRRGILTIVIVDIGPACDSCRVLTRAFIASALIFWAAGVDHYSGAAVSADFYRRIAHTLNIARKH